MASPQDCSVLVVGAGPVGLLAALDLARGGVNLAVVDERSHQDRGSRATTLSARTMEILSTRDLLDELGDLPHSARSHFAGLPLDLDVDSPFSGQWKLPQAELENVLITALSNEGVEVSWDTQFEGVESNNDNTSESTDVCLRVGNSTEQISARHILGCDGERSTVRQVAGINLLGDPGNRWLVRADIRGINIPSRHFEVLEQGMVTAATLPNGSIRVMAHLREFEPSSTTHVSFAEICSIWQTLTGTDISAGQPVWTDIFKDSCQWAKVYQAGPYLLAGDAAHSFMPAGGQPLNLGLEEAVTLAWRLVAIYRDGHDRSLLNGYSAQAQVKVRRVAANVHAQAHLLLSETDLEPQRRLMSELLNLDSVETEAAGVISGTGLITAGETDSLTGLSLPDFDVMDSAGNRHRAGEHLAKGRSVYWSKGDEGHQSEDLGVDIPGLTSLQGEICPLDGASSRLERCANLNSFITTPDGRIAWTSDDGTSPSTAIKNLFGARMPTPNIPQAMQEVVSSPQVHTSGSRLVGKQALVTGASRGIGRGIALRLASDGATVAVHCAQQRDQADGVVREIQANGGSAFVVISDFASTNSLATLRSETMRQFSERSGRNELDILVNNAGVMGGNTLEETTEHSFDSLFKINVKTPFFLIKELLGLIPYGGRVINISSGLTKVANPTEIAYAMTKGSVEQLTFHLAKAVATRDITVNSVAPGVTNNGGPIFHNESAVEAMSQLSPFGRVGEPDDIAGAVSFLASDDSRWVTGSVIEASGGTVLG